MSCDSQYIWKSTGTEQVGGHVTGADPLRQVGAAGECGDRGDHRLHDEHVVVASVVS